MMHYNGHPIGITEAIHTHNWNMDIGWLMDVALLPDYQGMGLGKHLIVSALHAILAAGYEQAGLAVTLSNHHAHILYTHLGFEEYDFFVEILGKDVTLL